MERYTTMSNIQPSSLIDTQIISEKIRQRDKKYLCHPWSPLNIDRSELTLVHGSAYRVWDIEGKEYIDASSLNMICGYAHRALIETMSEQSHKLHGVDISTASNVPAGLLAERIAHYLPKGFTKTLFVNSGSEGLEAAVFMAASYWDQIGQPRSHIVTFKRGYHGSTLLDRNLSGLPRVAHPFGQAISVTHVPLPAEPRNMRTKAALRELLLAFEQALTSDNKPPMAVIVEPFLNVGGAVVLPDGFLSGLRNICDKSGALLILDEVFTGYGRTGRMFAFQHENAIPDILVTSKALASGYMPIAAVNFKDTIYESFRDEKKIGGVRYGHTTSGHAVACAVALKTLDILEKEQLMANAAHFGDVLLGYFKVYLGRNHVVDVRGFGLIFVIEVSSPEKGSELHALARKNGLLLRQHGEVLMVVPPLSVDKAGIDDIIYRLEQCLQSLAK